MPRLFTGLALPIEVTAKLAGLAGGLFGARFVEPEDYHVTLRFIGDIDHRMADEIALALGGLKRKPFRLTLRGLDTFGKDRPRAVHALVEPNRQLDELAADHERIMRRLGLAPESRRFVPHVTIARLSGVHPADAAGWIIGRSPFSAGPFDVDAFSLFSSRDSVGGGPYVEEASYPLVG
jgi:RNA 2',3'-cyclic 3'-phosphodiesterase